MSGCVDPVNFAKLESAVETLTKELTDLKRYLKDEYLTWVQHRMVRLEADVVELRQEMRETNREMRRTLTEIARKVWIISGSISVLTGLIVGVFLRATGGG